MNILIIMIVLLQFHTSIAFPFLKTLCSWYNVCRFLSNPIGGAQHILLDQLYMDYLLATSSNDQRISGQKIAIFTHIYMLKWHIEANKDKLCQNGTNFRPKSCSVYDDDNANANANGCLMRRTANAYEWLVQELALIQQKASMKTLAIVSDELAEISNSFESMNLHSLVTMCYVLKIKFELWRCLNATNSGANSNAQPPANVQCKTGEQIRQSVAANREQTREWMLSDLMHFFRQRTKLVEYFGKLFDQNDENEIERVRQKFISLLGFARTATFCDTHLAKFEFNSSSASETHTFYAQLYKEFLTQNNKTGKWRAKITLDKHLHSEWAKHFFDIELKKANNCDQSFKMAKMQQIVAELNSFWQFFEQNFWLNEQKIRENIDQLMRKNRGKIERMKMPILAELLSDDGKGTMPKGQPEMILWANGPEDAQLFRALTICTKEAIDSAQKAANDMDKFDEFSTKMPTNFLHCLWKSLKNVARRDDIVPKLHLQKIEQLLDQDEWRDKSCDVGKMFAEHKQSLKCILDSEGFKKVDALINKNFEYFSPAESFSPSESSEDECNFVDAMAEESDQINNKKENKNKNKMIENKNRHEKQLEKDQQTNKKCDETNDCDTVTDQRDSKSGEKGIETKNTTRTNDQIRITRRTNSFGARRSANANSNRKPFELRQGNSSKGQMLESPKGQLAEGTKRRMVESPKGRMVESPKGQMAESPKGQMAESPKGRMVESPKGQMVDNTKGRMAKNPKDLPLLRRVDSTNNQIAKGPKGQMVESPKANNFLTDNCTKMLEQINITKLSDFLDDLILANFYKIYLENQIDEKCTIYLHIAMFVRTVEAKLPNAKMPNFECQWEKFKGKMAFEGERQFLLEKLFFVQNNLDEFAIGSSNNNKICCAQRTLTEMLCSGQMRRVGKNIEADEAAFDGSAIFSPIDRTMVPMRTDQEDAASSSSSASLASGTFEQQQIKKVTQFGTYELATLKAVLAQLHTQIFATLFAKNVTTFGASDEQNANFWQFEMLTNGLNEQQWLAQHVEAMKIVVGQQRIDTNIISERAQYNLVRTNSGNRELDFQLSEEIINFITTFYGDEQKKSVINELKSQIYLTLKNWVKKRTNFDHPLLLTNGSHMMNAELDSSDLDLLCVVPNNIDLYDFLGQEGVTLFSMLKKNFIEANVNGVGGKVPLIRIELGQVEVDVLFVPVPAKYLEDNANLESDQLIRELGSESAIYSLAGYRSGNYQLSLVNDRQTFSHFLRAIKVWAKARLIYSGLFGYLNGATLSVMATKICALFPFSTLTYLLYQFFQIYSTWNWQSVPVIVDKLSECPSLNNLATFCPQIVGSSVTVITPRFPQQNAAFNVNKFTLPTIVGEMEIANQILNETPEKWLKIFEEINFMAKFAHFALIWCADIDSDRYTTNCGFHRCKIRRNLLEWATAEKVAQMLAHYQLIPQTEQRGTCKILNHDAYCTFWVVGLTLKQQKNVNNLPSIYRSTQSSDQFLNDTFMNSLYTDAENLSKKHLAVYTSH